MLVMLLNFPWCISLYVEGIQVVHRIRFRHGTLGTLIDFHVKKYYFASTFGEYKAFLGEKAYFSLQNVFT